MPLGLSLALLATLLGRTASPVAGIVTTAEGKPIAGVSVYGRSTICCFLENEKATTDQAGRFRIEHPGPVIHFFRENLQPKTYVLRPTKALDHIVLEPSTGDLTIPPCGKVTPDQERIGWGNYELRFNVVKGKVRILGGTPDVDYVAYVIRSQNGKAHLELWFGLQAIDVMPEDAQFLKSDTFEQRNVTAEGKFRGLDSWGRERDGRRWRYTSVLGEGGSIYRNASPAEASLFDEIVNSLCRVPYPKQH